MNREHLSKIYLKPGEVHIAEQPTQVTTLLGSCVTVTLFNGRLRIGAICHGLLPEYNDSRGCDCGSAEHFKYVDSAIKCMLRKFSSYGVGSGEIDAKLFGGADMFNFRKELVQPATVGRLNINMAQQVLAAEGIHLVASDVGGSVGRRICFYTHTGEVLLKRLHKEAADDSQLAIGD